MSLAGAFANASNEDAALAAAAEAVLALMGWDSCDILLKASGDALELRATTEAPELVHRLRLAQGVGIVGECLRRDGPVFVTRSLTTNPLFQAFPEMDESRFQSAAVVPLRANGELVGALALRRREAWQPDRAESEKLQKLADEVIAYLHVYKGAFEAGSHVDKLEAVAEAMQLMTESPYLEEILQNLTNLTARRFNYKVVSVRLLDDRRNALVLRSVYSPSRAYIRRPVIQVGESVSGQAVLRLQTIVVGDVVSDPTFLGREAARELGLKSMVCVPLMIQSRAVGVMSCYAGETREFAADEISALEAVARQAAVAIEHARLRTRDTLIQEMHHRVKNNLQQVASLLRLQVRHGGQKSTEEVLTDTLLRVEAIASVHELLSREDLDHVGLTSLANLLVQHQQQSFMLPGKSVEFSVRGDDVTLSTNQATQVALILNELILNAVEHGFQTADSGQVHVTVEERDGTISLWVSNDGDALDRDHKGGLGLKIIEGLSRSLGGQFTLEDRLGWTVAEVRFARIGQS